MLTLSCFGFPPIYITLLSLIFFKLADANYFVVFNKKKKLVLIRWKLKRVLAKARSLNAPPYTYFHMILFNQKTKKRMKPHLDVMKINWAQFLIRENLIDRLGRVIGTTHTPSLISLTLRDSRSGLCHSLLRSTKVGR